MAGDKEPVPPPSRLPFVALSPSLLVTHDYALSTADQVLLFASNSVAIIVSVCWAPNVVHTVCPLTMCFAYGYHTVMRSSLHSLYPAYTYGQMLCSVYRHTVQRRFFHIDAHLAERCD